MRLMTWRALSSSPYLSLHPRARHLHGLGEVHLHVQDGRPELPPPA